MKYTMSIVIVIAYSSICACTNLEDKTDRLALASSLDDKNEDSEGSTPTQEGLRDWFDVLPDMQDCVGLRNVSIVADWPDVPKGTVGADTPYNEDGMTDKPTDPSCFLARFGRVAEVSIDAIVREYIHETLGTTHWTVYRLAVVETISGEDLPGTVYAATVTGRCNWNAGQKGSCYSYPAAKRTVGEGGIALLDSLGYDPIMAQANLGEENTALTVIPARVLSFGVFLPEINGTLDADRENEILGALVGPSFDKNNLLNYIARSSEVTCHQNPSVCGNCDTSQACYGKSFDPPCICINDWQGCMELPAEEPNRCQLFSP